MTPAQLKREVEKFRREYGNDLEAAIEEVLERWLDKHLKEENERHTSMVKNNDWKKADEIAIEINKKRIKQIEYFWENACKFVYPKFEERIKVKINQGKEYIKGFEKSLKER